MIQKNENNSRKDTSLAIDKIAHLRNPFQLLSRIAFLIIIALILYIGLNRRSFVLIIIGGVLVATFALFLLNGLMTKVSLSEQKICIRTLTDKLEIKKKNTRRITRLIPKKKNTNYREYIIEYEDEEENEVIKKRIYGIYDYATFEDALREWDIPITNVSKRKYNKKTAYFFAGAFVILSIIFMLAYFGGNNKNLGEPSIPGGFLTDSEDASELNLHKLSVRMQSVIEDLNQGHLFEGIEKPIQARRVFLSSDKLMLFSTEEPYPRLAILYLFSDTTLNFSIRLCFDELCKYYSEFRMKASDFSHPPAFITSADSPLVDIELKTSINDLRGTAFLSFGLDKIEGLWIERVELIENEARREEHAAFDVKEVIR